MYLNIFILVFTVAFLFSARLKGQDFNTLNYTNPILLNPSYVGLSTGTTGFTSFNSFYSGGSKLYNQFSFTLDSRLEKLKGGIGLLYKNELIGDQNLNLTEVGLMYARKFITRNNTLVPSLYVGYEKAVKNWFVYFLDAVLNRKLEPPNPPGRAFQRFDTFKPAIGFIWDRPSERSGISLQLNFLKRTTIEEEIKTIPPRIIALYTRKVNGKRNGLISKPYQIYPEVLFLFEDDLIQSRLSLKIEQKTKFMMIFSQNNFTDNYYSIGGTLGFRSGNLKLYMTNSIGIPIISSRNFYSGELSIGIFLENSLFDKNYPFAPFKNNY